MKSIRLKKMIVFFVIGVLIFTSTASVNAATYNLNVTKYSQEYANWCWVACAKMIGNYYGSSYSQSTICTYVKGGAVNDTATLDEITSAIKFASNKTVFQGGTVIFDAFVMSIKNSKPSVLRMAWDSGGGHVYVVSGVQEESGPALACLYLIDPFAGTSSALISYSKLINGTTLSSGTGKYSHTWTVNP